MPKPLQHSRPVPRVTGVAYVTMNSPGRRRDDPRARSDLSLCDPRGAHISQEHRYPAEAFDRIGRARLVLITCGGPFDPSTGNYRDNIVAYAVPGG
jgi:hypothetical protein